MISDHSISRNLNLLKFVYKVKTGMYRLYDDKNLQYPELRELRHQHVPTEEKNKKMNCTLVLAYMCGKNTSLQERRGYLGMQVLQREFEVI